MIRPLLSLFIASVLTVQLSAQKLSSIEKKLISSVSGNMPQTLSLLEAMVNINSGSLNAAGVIKSGDLAKIELEKMGFTVEWLKMPDTVKNAGHLIAVRKGKKGKKLLLLGHLDTVFEPDMPANPFRVINDSTATGQGILDDKGGVVVIVAALQALAKTNSLQDVNITVYLTGDEELGGVPVNATRTDLIERAKQHDIALNFEAGSIDKVTTGRRGADMYTLKTFGKQSHSSGVFSERGGYGAIYEASRILDSFQTVISKIRYLTSSPGMIAGGTTLIDSTDHMIIYGKDNIIASKAAVVGDLRFLGEKQRADARILMKSIVENGSLPGTHAEISFDDGIPSMEPTPENKKLAEQFNQVNLDMGFGPLTEVDPMTRGAGDISFIAGYIPSIDGLGPNGQGSHAPGELLNTKMFPLQIQRAAVYLYRLTR